MKQKYNFGGNSIKNMVVLEMPLSSLIPRAWITYYIPMGWSIRALLKPFLVRLLPMKETW
uniref:Uncharacterized protein n=1 Tax=Candidatus Kentrum sp. TC TaxID=2126339 RepID=A0A450ZDI9_9GAMM|nr:MAG: hypothetical protein BECKTC1821E_GA0114239_11681 [Candidatus Kentron sp. TC]VFK51828.1 MAG: hypothetical protein BECKTC1821D_GA0114238_11429 [Candidatus Kentron sp. TC]